MIPSLFGMLEKRLSFFVLAVFIFEYLLFQSYFTANITPYYPKAHDQLVTYNSVYEAYCSVRDYGLLGTLSKNIGIKDIAFKGWTVPVLGLINTFLFGPSRLSVALVNFFFFVCGQLILWHFLYRWRGLPAAMLGWGLYLLGGTHYFWAGGLDDLRMDYAGMVTFGISFLSLVSFMEEPSRKKLWLSLLAFSVSLSTRSITMIYLLGAQVILLFFFGVEWLLRGEVNRKRVKLTALLFAGSLLEYGVFLAVYGRRFYGYYGMLLLTDEAGIRDAEFGVPTLFDRLLYYPKSAPPHFRNYIIVGIVLGSYLLLERMRSYFTQGQSKLQLFSGRAVLLFTIFGATILAIYTPLTFYSPSPVVIGVLTMPLVFVLVTIFIEGSTSDFIFSIDIIACVVAVLGLANYTSAMTTPRALTVGVRSEGKIVNQFFSDLDQYLDNRDLTIGALQSGTVIYWMLNHPGFFPLAFNVYLYEHNLEIPPPYVRHIYPPIFATTENGVMNNLKAADIVIAPSQMPPVRGFEYPFTESLRNLQPVWKQSLEREFLLRRTYSLWGGQWVIGLYIRPVRVAGYRVPNGLEYLGEGRPFFWLGNEKAEIQIYNFDHVEREVLLLADSWPGPSNPDLTSRHLHYEFGDGSGLLNLGEGANWVVSLPLTLKPGVNSLFLYVPDAANPSLNPNGDPRNLLLNISNVRFSFQ